MTITLYPYNLENYSNFPANVKLTDFPLYITKMMPYADKVIYRGGTFVKIWERE